MNVLVMMEYSGRVREAFNAFGHHAVSCDIIETEIPGEHSTLHWYEFLDKYPTWDLMVAHPPCTYLANSGNKHLYKGMKKENGKDPERWHNMREGARVMKCLLDYPRIPKRCIENPRMSPYGLEIVGPSTQHIQPWQFGHKEMKETHLWLRGLEPLAPTNVVGPPPADAELRKKWAVVHNMPPGPDRWKDRSRTYQGIADAMGSQWGGW